VTEAIGRSELNIGRCSSRRSSPDVLDFKPKKCDKVMHSVGGSGGGWSTGCDSMLLTLDHNALASCLNSEIADLQYLAYLVWNSEC